ncbi:MAG: hypothetical protein H6707_06240 [Deltaproteobacteria bacterium]|nr:hypothetical protein [Deltaproteobacteria bacterium]
MNAIRQRKNYRPLGEWLVARGMLNRTQLFLALSAAHRHRCRFGDAVVWLGYASRELLEKEVIQRDRLATLTD